MLRTALLGGNSITLDADMSKYIETLSEQGVIEGLEVSSGSVAPGKAWVKATRSNGETIMTLVQNTEALAVDTSGTKKIWLEIKQEAIDNGALNNEDGTGIASIKTGPSVPSQNFLLLASVADGQIKDERNLIPKIQSVAQKTSTLEEKLSTAEGQISQLVEAGTPSYLGITAIVGEKYTMEDTLFLQKTPTLADALISINVGDVDANKEQHIQRISSGESSSNIKLKMDKFGLPTTNVIVEVRKGIKVDVSEKEAYWYGGDELLASASLPYTTFNTEAQEITVNLNQSFQLPKGELYSIVVKQENGIVNASNYYRLYCDATQYSEAFSAVAVNGSSRVRSKLMPYCASGGFIIEFFAKNKMSAPTNTLSHSVYRSNENITFSASSTGHRPGRSKKFYEYTAEYPGTIRMSFVANITGYNAAYAGIFVSINGNKKYSLEYRSSISNFNGAHTLSVQKGDIIRIYAGAYGINDYSDGRGGMDIRSMQLSYTTILSENPQIKLSPIDVIEIGEQIGLALFGIKPNGSFYQSFVDSQKTTSATSGDIPPINAVGYWRILGSDGKRYKIRVYGE